MEDTLKFFRNFFNYKYDKIIKNYNINGRALVNITNEKLKKFFGMNDYER